jgi:anti-anti-sigma regulatory factor
MTQTVARDHAAPPLDVVGSFEVATVAADGLRAIIRTTGPLTSSGSAVLIGVLRAHLRAGRHYLRVDVAGSPVLDPAVLAALTAAHRQVAAAGGMLVFENAGPQVVDAIRNSDLFVQAAY